MCELGDFYIDAMTVFILIACQCCISKEITPVSLKIVFAGMV